MEATSATSSGKTPGFLTKERQLGARTKRVLLVSFTVLVIAGCFYPSVLAFVAWSGHRQCSYQGKVIKLPVFWSEESDSTGSWTRPRHHTFTAFGDFLDVMPPMASKDDTKPFEMWHKVYGFSSADDFKKAPELQTLVNIGMICGSVKYGQIDGKPDEVIAVGCLNRDHTKTFQFTGMQPDLKAAISIIQQAQ